MFRKPYERRVQKMNKRCFYESVDLRTKREKEKREKEEIDKIIRDVLAAGKQGETKHD